MGEPVKPTDQQPFGAASTALPESLKKLIDEGAEANLTLLREYQKADEKAKAGGAITARDFTEAEARFERDSVNIRNKVQALLKDNSNHTYSPEELRRAIAYETSLREQAKNNNTALVDSALDPAPLQQAFVKEYIDHPKYKKNLDIDGNPSTDKDLLLAVLAKNRGAAIGETHTQDESVSLLSRNMAALKAAGVDTIYCETPLVVNCKDLSDDQLRTLMRDGALHYTAKDGASRSVFLHSSAELASNYGENSADETEVEKVKMILAARQNGIRLVHIDSNVAVEQLDWARMHRGTPTEQLRSVDFRVARTNFIWTDTVESDRQQLETQGKVGGKFVVTGGYNHFAKSGMVSKALGVPLLMFEGVDKATSPAFRRGARESEADFYLPGGNDYPDEKRPRMRTPQGVKEETNRTAKAPSGSSAEPAIPSWGMLAAIAAGVVLLVMFMRKLFGGGASQEAAATSESPSILETPGLKEIVQPAISSGLPNLIKGVTQHIR